MAPSEQKALIISSKGGEFAVGNATVPSPGAGEVLARVDATALNPIDWKVQRGGYEDLIQYPGILGSDAAGVVEEVGESVTTLQKGDKIVWQGMFKNDRATFQQYTVVSADLAAKIPPNVTVDEAATIPLGLATAFLALYNTKRVGQAGGAELTPFWKSSSAYAGQPFVLLGGATSVGQFVIQLARLSGFSPIIATASAKHADYLESLGATHVLSRSLPADALASEIADIALHPVKIVYDAVGVAETQKTAWSLLAPGGRLILVLPAAEGIVHGVENKELVQVFGNVNYPGQDEVGRELYAHLGRWLQDGAIRPNRVQVLPNGLAGIPDGLELLRQEKVSGVKLVAYPHETP
ncbi:GroES-like protein [Punctularia strigosozonata HHB-11173 SS5]|uniref:GroES-like protein n=1 Tax=Punctularia strigosozonata (strain HHB-11173) TaxID=741275 RepID=UPI0004417E62|nr:GroES-like protein [Punctularia strigosozonata HHB-11173 SS5]EIN12423.1 GroES-like protein [Punctularia strigosozonata HHB-11173 SS5]